ncbi:Zn-dependent exopeptidase [Xylariaceae sp. FL0594]|nr:Zn-dependent exopeptidase [Xylariaceae sp. FL0594]
MKLLSKALVLAGTSLALRIELQQPLDSRPESALQPNPSSSSSKNDAPAYRDELVSLHKDLVDISSVTYDEYAVGNFLVDYLKERKFATEVQIVPSANTTGSDADERHRSAEAKPRFNVLAWPGSKPRPGSFPKVIVSSHIDTVPPFFPYSRTGDGGDETVIGGRGSVDAKASVAAQVVAVQELLRARSVRAEDVMLLFVVGEERTGDGMRFFSETLASLDPPPPAGKIKAAIFGEPTEGKLACGHKGFFGCTITAYGKAAHSGYPWLGKSANEILMRALVKILDADLGSSDEFGNTTINVGIIEGGVALNVVPEKAVARIAGRVAIGPELEGGSIVKQRVLDILSSVDKDAFETECVNGYGVVKAACDVPGFEPITLNYGTDIPNFKGDHTRYLYGPGSILVAHGANEAIKLKDLESGVEGYKKLILHVLSEETEL